MSNLDGNQSRSSKGTELQRAWEKVQHRTANGEEIRRERQPTEACADGIEAVEAGPIQGSSRDVAGGSVIQRR